MTPIQNITCQFDEVRRIQKLLKLHLTLRDSHHSFSTEKHPELTLSNAHKLMGENYVKIYYLTAKTRFVFSWESNLHRKFGL